jgi:SAM-dependent methyltransferase
MNEGPGPEAGRATVTTCECKSDDRLTTAEFWGESFWKLEQEPLPEVTFDPLNAEFAEFHARLQRLLPGDGPSGRRTCLEIGCTPGRYLWYLWKYYGYEPHGIEYVAEAAERSQELLRQAGVPAHVTHADLFTFAVPDEERFDLVLSVGLIEHFRDIGPPLARHVALTRPGGRLLIIVPNHWGLNGWILRLLWPDFYRMHNQMNWNDLQRALARHPELEVQTGGYVGRFNLAPSNFCPWMRARLHRSVYRMIEWAHTGIMRVARVFPDNRFLSPYVWVIARRRETERPAGPTRGAETE